MLKVSPFLCFVQSQIIDTEDGQLQCLTKQWKTDIQGGVFPKA
jgi:hypothetical protein